MSDAPPKAKELIDRLSASALRSIGEQYGPLTKRERSLISGAVMGIAEWCLKNTQENFRDLIEDEGVRKWWGLRISLEEIKALAATPKTGGKN